MRLCEAYFLEKFHDIFLRRNDQLQRTGLDARYSGEKRVIPYRKVVCDKYNIESWIPISKVFPIFHHKLGEFF